MEQTTDCNFVDWLAQQLGTRMWVVARRSKRRIEAGYERFLTQRKFKALKILFEKETGPMDSLSDHLTESSKELKDAQRVTRPGQAFWAGTGPGVKKCRDCAHWKFNGYAEGSGLLRDVPCDKYERMMNGISGPRVPHYARSCKYFEQGAERSIEKPANSQKLPLNDN